MLGKGSGVILTLSSSAAGLSGRDPGSTIALAGLRRPAPLSKDSRALWPANWDPHGIRVVCLRSDALPETWTFDAPETKSYMANGTALGRLPTLAEVANAAVFVASDRAGAMTGTIVNLTCGSVMDSD